MRPTLIAIAFALILNLLPAFAHTTGDSFQDCATCPEMVVIPSGSAVLGSEPWIANRKRHDGPIREVTIDYTLAISKFEITRAQYRSFVKATGYETTYKAPRIGCNTWNYDGLFGFVLEFTWDSPGFDQTEDHPAVCLSWADATAYAAWLADATGKPYRLLSATEFEYATRAGTRGPWFWGQDNTEACSYANVADSTFRRLHNHTPVFACDDGYERTAPVGSFAPNPWGLHDMFGNAWEWTDDCVHNDMSNIPTDGSAWYGEDNGDCERRTPRGGSWKSGTDWVRAAAQASDRALYHSQQIGIRIGLTLE